MEALNPTLEANYFASMPCELTEMVAQQVPVNDLRNVACVSRKINRDLADLLRNHRALIREYRRLCVDIWWLPPYREDNFGWDIVRSGPIIQLCSILKNVKYGHYIRDICYTPKSKTDSSGVLSSAFKEQAICHGGALNPAEDVEVLQQYILAHQLDDDIEQSIQDRRTSSDARVPWNEEFIEHLKIDYGLYLRILLPIAPNLTTLEISWNFDLYSPINDLIKTASEGPRPFLQHLTKVKLLLGQRSSRMSIGAFMAIPSLRWLSIHNLCGFARRKCYPESVGYTKLLRLELVDCALSDEDLHTYLDMFHSLEHVEIHMIDQVVPLLRYCKSEDTPQPIDSLFKQCGHTLRHLCMLNIGFEEGSKSLESFFVLQSLTLQISSLFSLEDQEPRMISQLPRSIETLILWNDLTKKVSALQSMISLLFLSKYVRKLSLRSVQVATGYTSLAELQRWKSHFSHFEEDLAGFGISFQFLERSNWPPGNLLRQLLELSNLP